LPGGRAGRRLIARDRRERPGSKKYERERERGDRDTTPETAGAALDRLVSWVVMGEEEMNHGLLLVTLVSASIIACGGGDASDDDCAFRAQDGSCAVTLSSSGAYECQLEDAALCNTVTGFLENGTETIGQSTAALHSAGGGISPAPSLICEPPGTFMCTCCSVSAGCYRCPN
jgi:hypothetical protein